MQVGIVRATAAIALLWRWWTLNLRCFRAKQLSPLQRVAAVSACCTRGPRVRASLMTWLDLPALTVFLGLSLAQEARVLHAGWRPSPLTMGAC